MATLSDLALTVCQALAPPELFPCTKPCEACVCATQSVLRQCATDARLLNGVWTGQYLEGIASQHVDTCD